MRVVGSLPRVLVGEAECQRAILPDSTPRVVTWTRAPLDESPTHPWVSHKEMGFHTRSRSDSALLGWERWGQSQEGKQPVDPDFLSPRERPKLVSENGINGLMTRAKDSCLS